MAEAHLFARIDLRCLQKTWHHMFECTVACELALLELKLQLDWVFLRHRIPLRTQLLPRINHLGMCTLPLRLAPLRIFLNDVAPAGVADAFVLLLLLFLQLFEIAQQHTQAILVRAPMIKRLEATISVLHQPLLQVRSDSCFEKPSAASSTTCSHSPVLPFVFHCRDCRVVAIDAGEHVAKLWRAKVLPAAALQSTAEVGVQAARLSSKELIEPRFNIWRPQKAQD